MRLLSSCRIAHRFLSTTPVCHLGRNPTPGGINGYVILFPELPPDSATDNEIISNVHADQLPSFGPDYHDLEKCVNSIASLAMNGGVAITEHIQKIGECKEDLSLSEVLGPIEQECNKIHYAVGLYRNAVKNCGKNEQLTEKDFNKVNQIIFKATSAHYNEKILYSRLKEFEASRKGLTESENALLEKYMSECKVVGTHLPTYERGTLTSVYAKLKEDQAKFFSNIPEAHRGFVTQLSSIAEFDNTTPLHVLKILAEDENKVVEGPWNVRLTPAQYWPFIRYCKSHIRRELVWQCFNTQGAFKQYMYNNSIPIDLIREGRLDIAQCLGYDNYMQLSMSTKMAATTENVKQFLTSLKIKIEPKYKERIQDLQEFASQQDGRMEQLNPSDLYYYSRKYAEKCYGLSSREMSKYFPIWPTIDKIMLLFKDWFEVAFEPLQDVKVWAENVRVCNAIDTRSGEVLGVVYIDDSVKPATGSSLQLAKARTLDGPAVMFLNLNSTPNDTPSFEWQELEALFRSFGDCLQWLLSAPVPCNISGKNNLPIDALDAFKYWTELLIYQPAFLSWLSQNNGDGIDVQRAEEITEGFIETSIHELYRRIFISHFDLEIHTLPPRKHWWYDVYREMHAEYFPYPYHKKDFMPCHFTPMFTAAHGACYYSDLWSRMLACDMMDAFKEVGFDKSDSIRSVARKLRDTVLVAGGAASYRKVFSQFRGRDPSLAPFYEFYGIDTEESSAEKKKESV